MYIVKTRNKVLKKFFFTNYLIGNIRTIYKYAIKLKYLDLEQLPQFDTSVHYNRAW